MNHDHPSRIRGDFFEGRLAMPNDPDAERGFADGRAGREYAPPGSPKRGAIYGMNYREGERQRVETDRARELGRRMAKAEGRLEEDR